MTTPGHTQPTPAPAWMAAVLKAAAIYNVLWGASVVLAPGLLFELLAVPEHQRPNATGTAIWQCVGMIVGVYGVGYWAASSDPARHWPIVLVGLLGKVLGPIGFVDAALVRQAFPVSFGWTILTNDLIWWAPFALILLRARRLARSAQGAPPPPGPA